MFYTDEIEPVLTVYMPLAWQSGHEAADTLRHSVVSIVPAIAGGSEDVVFSNEEMARYEWHIIIPEFGFDNLYNLKAE